jgi:mono/diheme cytochrome c family protein
MNIEYPSAFARCTRRHIIRIPLAGLSSLLAMMLMNNAASAATQPADFARGAQVWAQTCAHCHGLRDPLEFRDDQWHVIVTHMRIRAGLTGRDTRDILLFLQQSNSKSPGTFLQRTATSSGPTASDTGAAIYQQTCVACHGQNGKGAIPGAPDFTRPDGVLTQPRDVLLKHSTEGFQRPGSAMAMPPRGGNPALTDAQIERVLDYLREHFGHEGARH